LSAADRRARALVRAHQKLNALRLLLKETQEAIALLHARGDATEADIAQLGDDVHALVVLIASRRWDVATPEAITMARILQELARSPQGV
jgi:hypothetical protein